MKKYLIVMISGIAFAILIIVLTLPYISNSIKPDNKAPDLIDTASVSDEVSISTTEDKITNKTEIDHAKNNSQSSQLICKKFYTPFALDEDRDSYSSIEIRSMDGFGAYRIGHVHAGLDLKADYAEPVYPIASGQVADILYSFPNLAVLIKHHLPDGAQVYSSYVHVADISVNIGDIVDENTQIARILNKDELQKAGFNTPHLHLEIRKNMDDDGKGSYSCKTIEELDKYFLDPTPFLKEKLND